MSLILTNTTSLSRHHDGGLLMGTFSNAKWQRSRAQRRLRKKLRGVGMSHHGERREGSHAGGEGGARCDPERPERGRAKRGDGHANARYMKMLMVPQPHSYGATPKPNPSTYSRFVDSFPPVERSGLASSAKPTRFPSFGSRHR